MTKAFTKTKNMFFTSIYKATELTNGCDLAMEDLDEDIDLTKIFLTNYCDWHDANVLNKIANNADNIRFDKHDAKRAIYRLVNSVDDDIMINC